MFTNTVLLTICSLMFLISLHLPHSLLLLTCFFFYCNTTFFMSLFHLSCLYYECIYFYLFTTTDIPLLLQYYVFHVSLPFIVYLLSLHLLSLIYCYLPNSSSTAILRLSCLSSIHRLCIKTAFIFTYLSFTYYAPIPNIALQIY